MKKIVILAYILIIATVCTFSISAADFSDMPSENHWAYNALRSAVENKLLSGSDGMLLPFNSLTRAQMATILVRAYGVTEKADISDFKDVAPEKWYYDSMAIAVNSGWFKGDNSGLLNPDKNITRQEVFVVLSRVLGAQENESTEKLDTFNDASSVPSWAENAVAFMLNKEYIGGSNGYINPKNEITRAEFAQIIYNLINKGALTIISSGSENNTEESTDKTEDTENAENAENSDNTESTENAEDTENSENTEDSENTENNENSDNTEDKDADSSETGDKNSEEKAEVEEIVVVDKPAGGLIIEDASQEDDDDEYVFVFPDRS